MRDNGLLVIQRLVAELLIVVETTLARLVIALATRRTTFATPRRALVAGRRLFETAGCRRALLLRHFGENPPEKCGNCDNCLEAPGVFDATQLAQKLLSAAYRTGQAFGFGHLEKVLIGQGDERISQRGHDQLSVFGIVPRDEAHLLRPLVRALQARGSLVPTEHGGLALGGDARQILTGEQPVLIALSPVPERGRGGGRRQKSGAVNPQGDPLFDALRELRRAIASEAGVPPYVVFQDSTLREMATVRPASLVAMGQITGVGTRKLDAHGEAFLAVIRQF